MEHIEKLPTQLEALIFASEQPLKLAQMQEVLQAYWQYTISQSDILKALEYLTIQYQNSHFAFELREVAQGYFFYTKPEQAALVQILVKTNSRQRLSKAALETLAIIAYQQPITKANVEHIRGVNCDYAIHKLLEKELIEIKGRSSDVGRPLLYGTSNKFMQHFGLSSMQGLPKLKDLQLIGNTIGNIEEH